VISAVPFSEASGSLNVVARALVIFTPLLFLAFTGSIWLVTGRRCGRSGRCAGGRPGHGDRGAV